MLILSIPCMEVSLTEFHPFTISSNPNHSTSFATTFHIKARPTVQSRTPILTPYAPRTWAQGHGLMVFINGSRQGSRLR